MDVRGIFHHCNLAISMQHVWEAADSWTLANLLQSSGVNTAIIRCLVSHPLLSIRSLSHRLSEMKATHGFLPFSCFLQPSSMAVVTIFLRSRTLRWSLLILLIIIMMKIFKSSKLERMSQMSDIWLACSPEIQFSVLALCFDWLKNLFL